MEITFSNNFDSKLRFETGLYLPNVLGSRLIFFNNGLTIACFMELGKTPFNKQLLYNWTYNGSNNGKHFFKIQEGNGSRWDVFN